MKKHGVGCWSKLLPEFEGRIGKQLRERWNHELRPDINKQGWTHEEERNMVKAHREVGNSWAEIAKVGATAALLAPLTTTHPPLSQSPSFPKMSQRLKYSFVVSESI